MIRTVLIMELVILAALILAYQHQREVTNMTYQEFADFLDATGEMHDLIEAEYNQFDTKDLSGIMRGINRMARDRGISLMGREEFDEKEYFLPLFEEYGL